MAFKDVVDLLNDLNLNPFTPPPAEETEAEKHMREVEERRKKEMEYLRNLPTPHRSRMN